MPVERPAGSGDGPFVPQSLNEWGAKSSVAYTTLLNLSYEWWNPGVTRMQLRDGPTADGRRWVDCEFASRRSRRCPMGRTASRAGELAGWAARDPALPAATRPGPPR